MSVHRNYEQLVNTLHEYKRRLTGYSEERFQQQPSEGQWSPSQVYAHILTADRLSLKAVVRCANGKGQEVSDGPGFAGRLLLMTGHFPKGRKAPSSLAERTPHLESIHEASELTDIVLSDLHKAYQLNASFKKGQKMPHPVLGYLNAFEWIRFITIHTRHHLKQLDRIDSSFMQRGIK